MTTKQTCKRIQRMRTQGWQMPDNAVYVGRTTVWGNRYPPEFGEGVYERYIREKLREDKGFLDPLRGKDLACWCPLDKPCHADVLLRILSESE